MEISASFDAATLNLAANVRRRASCRAAMECWREKRIGAGVWIEKSKSFHLRSFCLLLCVG